MTDLVFVRNLRVKAHVGVTEEERRQPQPLAIDVEIAIDLRRAGRTDDLAHTVDYGRVSEEVAGLARSTTTELLEALAEQISDHILGSPGVERVTVGITKLAPPIEVEVGEVGVRIERAAG